MYDECLSCMCTLSATGNTTCAEAVDGVCFCSELCSYIHVIMYHVCTCMLSLTGTTGTVLKNANETRSTVAQNNQGTLLTSYNRPEQLGTCLPDKRPVRSNNSFAYAFIIRSLSMTKISS